MMPTNPRSVKVRFSSKKPLLKKANDVWRDETLEAASSWTGDEIESRWEGGTRVRVRLPAPHTGGTGAVTDSA